MRGGLDEGGLDGSEGFLLVSVGCVNYTLEVIVRVVVSGDEGFL